MKQRREKIKRYLTITRVKRAISARVISTLVTVFTLLASWRCNWGALMALMAQLPVNQNHRHRNIDT